MKANDLRIGNYVNVTNEAQCPFRIDGFEFANKSDCKIFKDNGTYNCPPFGDIPLHPLTWDLKDLSGIPLTEEILLKCGAKKVDKKDEFGGFIIYYPNGNGMRVKNNEWSSQHITVKLDFLHQLQNLYFALTNEELKINE